MIKFAVLNFSQWNRDAESGVTNPAPEDRELVLDDCCANDLLHNCHLASHGILLLVFCSTVFTRTPNFHVSAESTSIILDSSVNRKNFERAITSSGNIPVRHMSTCNLQKPIFRGSMVQCNTSSPQPSVPPKYNGLDEASVKEASNFFTG